MADAAIPDGGVTEVSLYLRPDAFRRDVLGNNPRASIADRLPQASHAGDNHRHFEMIGDRAYAALRG